MNKTSIGIIGCGKIAIDKHLPNLVNIPGVEVIGFSNRTQSKADAAREKFGTTSAKTYKDPYALINDPNIDVVHVCTSNQSHAAYTIAALNANKHVMVEKPMATNAKDAKAMLDAAKANKKLLSVSYQNRFDADIQALKSLVDKNTLGEIYYTKIHAVRRRGVPTWGTFLNKTIQGGGPLIDVGTHALDLALWVTGDYDVDYVVGSTYRKLHKDTPAGNLWGAWDPSDFEVEDSAFAMIKMRSGSTLIIEASYSLNTRHSKENKITLHGTKGGADLDDGLTLNFSEDNMLKTKKIKTSQNDLGALEMQHWIDAIKADKQPLVKAFEAYQVTRIIDAIYASAEQNKPIYLNQETSD